MEIDVTIEIVRNNKNIAIELSKTKREKLTINPHNKSFQQHLISLINFLSFLFIVQSFPTHKR